VLASGALRSGCTVHLVDETVDGGSILAQATVPVLPGDTPETLAARVAQAEHRLYPEVVGEVASGRLLLKVRVAPAAGG
ncbi:MAG: formyltransferase family protein, partial [Armatimonadota bacterium]|nr:formyltransferase family protein [Armatimonadota bacterium]